MKKEINEKYNLKKAKTNTSEFPIFLKRNMKKSLILYAFLFVFSLIFAVLNAVMYTLDATAIMFFICVLIFLLAFLFSIFLNSEVTYIIDKDVIISHSKLLMSENVLTDHIYSVIYSDEKRQSLKISYNLPEYDLKNKLGDFDTDLIQNTGLWVLYINKKDINIPIEELKVILQQFYIDKNYKLK